MSIKNKATDVKVEGDDQYGDASPGLFRAALLSSADGIFITDKSGEIKWVNPAFEKLTGYSRADVLNKNPRFLKSGKQDPEFYKLLWETISSGNTWNGELWNRRKNGIIYLEEQSITPLKDERGEITHYISTKRDITLQHQLLSQMHRARRLEAIGQLTAGVAHNFNNKLASILGFADLAEDEALQYQNKELDEFLDEIILASKSARDLVRQMMEFSQNKSSEQRLIDAGGVIKQAAKLISSALPDEVRVSVRLGDVTPIKIDPVRLHQMLMSIATNASNAMDGQGELTIATKIIRADVLCCASCHEVFSGDFICISVRDTGKGIVKEDLDNLFMPFFTTRKHAGGTGMGLSALHGMLHEASGHVLVDTVYGKYTEFKVLLPVPEGLPSDTIENYKKTSVVRGSKDSHVLLVDDDASVMNFISEILDIHGYRVTKETDAKTAFKLISENPDEYDLLITDQRMPRLSGLALAKMVADVKPGLPVVLMTGHPRSSGTDYHLEGVKAVLEKPFEIQFLLKMIKELLE